MPVTGPLDDPVDEYLRCGLRLGRVLHGAVDAYYGPEWILRLVDRAPAPTPHAVAADARALLARLELGELGPRRRRWMAAQLAGIECLARVVSGEPVPYVEEVQRCYGVTPRRIDLDEIDAAARELDAALPSTIGGDLRQRLHAVRAAHTVGVELLEPAVRALASRFREITTDRWGLPDGEQVEFELVTDRPWSGFNYFHGGCRSTVAINTDTPMFSFSLPHLVAHEAYPGHHTEHAHKEVGLVRGRSQWEESIFLVGTPQCVVAEGLADTALDALFSGEWANECGDIFDDLGIGFDRDVLPALERFGEVVSRARGNVGLMLHADGSDPRDAARFAESVLLFEPDRAAKLVEFLCDPTWRAYMSCYVEGYPLCRAWVGGDAARFGKLLDGQFVPADLVGDPC